MDIFYLWVSKNSYNSIPGKELGEPNEIQKYLVTVCSGIIFLMFLTPLSTWFPEKNTEVAKNCQSSLKTEIEITCLHLSRISYFDKNW